MTLVWHGNKIEQKFRRATRKNVIDAVLVIEAAAKTLVNKGGRTYSGEAEAPHLTGAIGTFRSKPGEPPRKQTGTLQGRITTDPHPSLPIARVGTNYKVGRYLEMGTRRMKPRPWLRPALMLSQNAIRKIMGRKPR